MSCFQMTRGRSLSVTSSSTGRLLDGPEQSKVQKLFEPTPVKIKDVETKFGRTRVFWVRDQKIKDEPPLVLLHGWGAGSGCFFKNIHEMATDRSILLIDLPGFAESERIKFSENPESDFLAALKAVINRELSNGEEFWLGGHSFGAYLAGSLALERGNDLNIKGIILMDAWGYGIMTESLSKLPWYVRCLYHIFGSRMTGLDLMRKFPEKIARPMLKKARKDLTNTYGEFFGCIPKRPPPKKSRDTYIRRVTHFPRKTQHLASPGLKFLVLQNYDNQMVITNENNMDL